MRRTLVSLVFIMIAVAVFQSTESRAYANGDKGKDKDKKKTEKKPEKKTGCDTSDLVRTTNDSLIMAKYVKVYQRLGGLCYIISLEHLGKLKKVSDSTYNIRIKDSNTTDLRTKWQTYLFCPIGKPNGIVTLFTEAGDTMQQCSYLNEKKEGFMYYWKGHNERFTAIHFVNDEQRHFAIDSLMSGY